MSFRTAFCGPSPTATGPSSMKGRMFPITPASTVNVVLSGDDLALEDHGPRRILTVLALYDSPHGDDLPMRARAVFNIDDLIAVS